MRKGMLMTLAAMAFAAAPVAAQTDATAAEAEARAIAGPWLESLDQGEYVQSWQVAAPAFQEGVPVEAWAERMRLTREQIGPLVGRTFAEARYSAEVPNAPPGEYVFVEYLSKFQNAPPTVESVVLRKAEYDGWQVAAMAIRPAQ